MAGRTRILPINSHPFIENCHDYNIQGFFKGRRIFEEWMWLFEESKGYYLPNFTLKVENPGPAKRVWCDDSRL